MEVLKQGTYVFPKITSLTVDRQPNVVSVNQFVNGTRKKVTTAYTDCVIDFTLTGLNATEMAAVMAHLIDGPYTYYYNGATYTDNFIVTVPALDLKRALDDKVKYNPITIHLEKSGDTE